MDTNSNYRSVNMPPRREPRNQAGEEGTSTVDRMAQMMERMAEFIMAQQTQLQPPNPHTNHHTKPNPQSEVKSQSQNPEIWYTGVMSPITGTEVQSQGP